MVPPNTPTSPALSPRGYIRKRVRAHGYLHNYLQVLWGPPPLCIFRSKALLVHLSEYFFRYFWTKLFRPLPSDISESVLYQRLWYHTTLVLLPRIYQVRKGKISKKYLHLVLLPWDIHIIVISNILYSCLIYLLVCICILNIYIVPIKT
jgi:hypothetical protein